MALLSFESPSSTDIQSATYETDTQTLIIFFKRNQQSYAWSNIPLELWYQFVEAKSVGKFFHANIKGKYQFGAR